MSTVMESVEKPPSTGSDVEIVYTCMNLGLDYSKSALKAVVLVGSLAYGCYCWQGSCWQLTTYSLATVSVCSPRTTEAACFHDSTSRDGEVDTVSLL